MATKPSPAKPKKPAPAAKAAPKPSASRALQPWEAEMAAAAQAAAQSEHITGMKTIQTRGGKLRIDGELVEGNALRGVVLASLHENQFFTGVFDANKPQTPTCYAYGKPGDPKPEAGMAPHEASREKQHTDCASCPMNRMGSADVGKGKACKNVRRLALVTEDALESVEALASAEIRLLKVPVMSTNNWARYVNRLNDDMQRTPWGVVTEISLEDDDRSQFRVNFEFQELVNFDADMYAAMKKRVAEASSMLQQPYPNLEDSEEEAPPRRGAKAAPVKRGAAPAKRAKY